MNDYDDTSDSDLLNEVINTLCTDGWLENDADVIDRLRAISVTIAEVEIFSVDQGAEIGRLQHELFHSRAQLAACLPVIAAAKEYNDELEQAEMGAFDPLLKQLRLKQFRAALALYDDNPPHGGETPVPT